jgi:hypothetical protein
MDQNPTTSRTPRLIAALAFSAILLGTLSLASAVLKPGRGGEQAGAAWTAYLAQPRNSVDVLFFGSSHVFDGVDPATLWRERGITSFVHGGPTQQLPVMKYYVRESLKTQSPKVIVLEMSTASNVRGKVNPAFHQINVGYMPWGRNKLEAILFETAPGQRTGVAVDLWTYHSRWSQVTRHDLEFWKKNRDAMYLKGFLPKVRSKSVTPTVAQPTPQAKATAEKKLDSFMPDLEAIVSEAEERDIDVLLLLTPTSPIGLYSYQAEEAYRRLSATHDNVRLLDLDRPEAVPGLSYETDFFDGGHLTYRGAEKASAVIARFLAETYGVPDHRGDSAFRYNDADAVARDHYIEVREAREAKKR